MVRTFLLAVIACLLLASCGDSTEQRPGHEHGQVLRASIQDQPITPVTARYVERVIKQAEKSGAACLILDLDTPGGLMESTRSIVRTILGSNVPVVVYVTPSGARAASAGVFITLAAHAAVMSPGTHIGAAHPVQVGGVSPVPEPSSPPQNDSSRTAPAANGIMGEKIVNDARAWVRSLAELRGRNAEWAESAVSESKSITASEANRINVIDFIAEDHDTLLRILHGREIQLPGGTVRLHTNDSVLRPVDMWWGERLLSTLSNPNIAFLLLLLGFYGLLFELYAPGWGISGTLGAMCLVLGFSGLALLPINIASLGLILLGLGLFVAEAFVPNYGVLTLGGVTCLILGGLMLVEVLSGLPRVSPALIIPFALATGSITFFLIGKGIKAQRARPRTGSEGLEGASATAQTDFTAEGLVFYGFVLVRGELWKATSSAPLVAGQSVTIVERQNLVLNVVPASPAEASPPVKTSRTES